MTLFAGIPARELASMEIDRLNQMFEDFYGSGRGWTPAVDILRDRPTASTSSRPSCPR